MSDSVLKFCPKCDSLFEYNASAAGETTDHLHLYCARCGYTVDPKAEGTDTVIRVKLSHRVSGGQHRYAMPTDNTRFDQALIKTMSLRCPNGECPSLNPENWTEDGANLPETVLFNKVSDSRVMHMLCTACNHSWRISPESTVGLGAGAAGAEA